MKKVLYIILVLGFSLTIISCAEKEESTTTDDTPANTSSDDSSTSTAGYTRENLPDETIVDLPSTLTDVAISSRTAYASLSDSMGLGVMQGSVAIMKSILALPEYYMIFYDVAISQSKMTAGNCYAAGEIEITFTAEMYQAIKDEFSKTDSEMSASDNSKYSAKVGTQISIPFPASYGTTTNRGFDKIISIGSSDATCSGSAVSSVQSLIMWTDNGSKLQYTFDLGSSSKIFHGTLAYDGSTNTSSFDVYINPIKPDVDVGFGFGGIFTECNSGVADCVTARVIMVSDDWTWVSRGKFDDNGGHSMTVQTVYEYDLSMWITEHWDTNLKSQMMAWDNVDNVTTCPNATWDNVSNCNFNLDMLNAYGETSSSSGLTSYETDAGKAFSQNWIATPGKSDAFLAASVGHGYALMTTSGSTNVENLGGVAVKLDNSTVGFVIYHEPTNRDNFTMQDLSASSNLRSFSSTVVDNLTLSY